MASAEILITSGAAAVVRTLAPTVKAALARFLREDLPDWAATHAPTEIRGLEGKYWVVQPRAGDERLAVLITQPETEDSDVKPFVVTAVVPEDTPPAERVPIADPTNIAIGAEVLRAAQQVG